MVILKLDMHTKRISNHVQTSKTYKFTSDITTFHYSGNYILCNNNKTLL